MANGILLRIGWLTVTLWLAQSPIGTSGQPLLSDLVDWSRAETHAYDKTVARAVALLPKRPAQVMVVDMDRAAPPIRSKFKHVDGFVTAGQPVVWLRMQGDILQKAQSRGGIFDYALATIIWHEMAHIAGQDELGAQKAEEALWTTFVTEQKVDRGSGIAYLSLLSKRRKSD
jgi:hypothetical protein